MQSMSRQARAAVSRAVAGALCALGLSCPLAASAACSVKEMALPVKMVGRRAVATLGINGTQVPLIVDSGMFFSMLTEAAAAQLNMKLGPLPRGMWVKGLTGKVDAQTTTVAHLGLVKAEIPDVQFIVGGNEPGAGAMGYMGRNLLSFTDMEYDLAHGVIRFVFPDEGCDDANMAYWASPETPVSSLDLQRQHGVPTPEIRGKIELNGHKVLALFDSGAHTLVSLDAAHRVGVADGDMTPDGQATGLGRGWAKQWTASFDKVDLGGEAVSHNHLAVVDFDMDEDMLIGIDFFLSHHIYISKKQSRMYFTYNGGPVFALNHGDPGSPGAADAAGDTLKADELARRGAASLSRHELAAALLDLDRACALEPANADFLATRATIHLAQQHADKALADLDAALRLDPAQDQARMQRTSIHMASARRDKALEDLAVLDQRLPPQSNLRDWMAQLYETFEMPAQALKQWNLWIPAHPHDVDLGAAYNGRCWNRAELGIELEQALDDCDAAVDTDPKNASFLDSRGWVYLRMGKLRKSLASFDRALAIQSDAVSSLYGRGLTHLRLGDAAPARADLEAARKIEPAVDARLKQSGLPTAPETAP
jgi:tetratricopeptide (TPR) repeat protein/predicted aspartyl protease